MNMKSNMKLNMKLNMKKINLKENNVTNYILKSNISSIIKIGILNVASMIVSFSIYLLYAYIIDGISAKHIGAKTLFIGIIGYICLTLAQSIVSFLNKYLSTVLQLKSEMKIRSMMVDKILKKKGRYFTETIGGELFELVMQDISIVTNFVIGNIFNIVGIGLNLIGTLIFLAAINYKIVLIIVAIQGLSYIVQRIVSKGVLIFSKDTRDNMAEYVSSIQDLFENPSEMIMSGLKNSFVERMDEKMKANYRLNKRMILTSMLGNSSMGLISQLTLCAVLGFSGYSIMTGAMSIGYFVTYINSTRDLMGYFDGMWSLSIDMCQIRPMYERVNTVYLENSITRSGEILNTLTPPLEYKDVTFGYSRERKIYENFSYTFAYGGSYGIVGRTGEGKSTLVKLLYDLWTPEKGCVKLGGTECKNLSVEQISRYVSYVSAQSIVLQDTIYNNVAFGNGNISREEVCAALKKACLLDEVLGMEGGIDSIVGESGSTLSNGQQQRLMLARAFAGKKKILILDEPTAALDSKTERIVMENFYKEYKDKTLIIITHNESILYNCDSVLRLNEGRLIVA